MSYIIPFFLSVAFGYFIVRFSGAFPRIRSLNNDIQAFHETPTPRMGGVSILLSFAISALFLVDYLGVFSGILIASMLVFTIGLVEDLTGAVSPFIRLLFIFLAISIAYYWADVGVMTLNISWADRVLEIHSIIPFLFTLLVVGGAVNSLNIIDGFNGLMSGYAILALLAFSMVAFWLGDNLVLQLNLLFLASMAGFFLINFPFGKLFMGDGGAYFIGFYLSFSGLILADRNDELSNWFVLLVLIYPMYETLFSIFRKKMSFYKPDADHLHSLVYKKVISCEKFKHNKVICNSMTAPIMWLLSLIGIVPAIVWFDKQNVLLGFIFIFMITYTIIYKLISSCKPSVD